MKPAFTLIESLIVVALLAAILGIATAGYRRAKWTSKIAAQSVEIRGKLNQAVSEGKFRKQKTFEDEMARLKRQTDIGLTQGK